MRKDGGMNDHLRLPLGSSIIALALAVACGDSAGDETGNDTQTASATTTVGESTGNESSSASQTASTTNTTSATTTESGSSGTEATASTTATDNSSSDADGSSSSGASSSGSESGMTCSADSESCANGELCCRGLICCAGVPVPPGQEYCGMDCPDSDRNIKESFAAVDAEAVLDKVATLPITSWSYKSEGSQVRHIGPMAQDFKATFEVGSSDRAIAKVDADGVALAAIQGLSRRVQDLQRENTELRERLAKLERAFAKRPAAK